MNTRNGQLVPQRQQIILTHFDTARRALEQARTIDEVKDVRDQAEACRLYARQIGESLEMQNAIAEIKLRAERKAGELLAKHGPQQGGDRKSKSKSQPATLKDLGINKTQSSRWQQEARVPEKVFERHVAEVKSKGKELTSTGLLDLAKELEKKDRAHKRKQAARAYRAAAARQGLADQNILAGDMGLLWDRLKDNSVDLFFTDPPWAEVNCYARLAELAAAKLKPGGLCICYTGKIFLPAVMDALRRHLEYWWFFGIRLAGQHMRIRCRPIRASWTPVLAFSKGNHPQPPDTISDLLLGTGGEKDLHPWQQSQAEAEYLIEYFTAPGQLVVDPFCGSGTFPAACKKLGRAWLATEIDLDTVAIARQRLAREPAGVLS